MTSHPNLEEPVTTPLSNQQLDEPYRFTDADGDYLHIGIPATPANGGPAISFATNFEPAYVPVEEVENLIAALRRLAAVAASTAPVPPAHGPEATTGPRDAHKPAHRHTAAPAGDSNGWPGDKHAEPGTRGWTA